MPVFGFHDPESFVQLVQKSRVIIMLVKEGAPVDQTIKTLSKYMEKGDCIIDGGNKWHGNTERREKAMAKLGLLYLGMGVSGGEEDERNAQVPDNGPCVTYIGEGGSGNFVKMNKRELLSFLIEITADIFGIKDDEGDGDLVDNVLDKTGMKGTAPTITASLDSSFLSGLKEERVEAAKVFKSRGFGEVLTEESVDCY
ncbi:PREDICTED: 6-phosphogluconate dehydrogenase, decarboxylating 3 [Theobroma cacao]|uniref:phosphogluconate dehydrogenase (NADP(+)-dependent, decarboxylating) n=1 Tax=Theobroma cacao TaxID=3641 RepID=A0AB32W914_THECC|nr:PREDICTED: 6-phosphogluconate dehydrogenase, decarboxylating 3 [Theobroma cacao]